jgi:glycosyltransferase involved in cell wall biosynthesis
MKKYGLILLVSTFLAQEAFASIINGERSIVAVVASYNNARWYKKNLDSIFSQKYSNYKVLYADDASPDGTGQLVADYVKGLGLGDKIVLVCNQIRFGNPLANHHHLITNYAADDDIVVIVDGDDWLAHDRVFAYLNNVYADSNVWMTYGQFGCYPSGAHGFNAPIPNYVVAHNSFRSHYNAFSHLRTYYAGLFKRIKLEDIMVDGKFLPMSGDIAVSLPTIEMARYHFKFIPDILYIYNETNELSEHRVSKELQRKVDLWVRSRPTYAALKSLF